MNRAGFVTIVVSGIMLAAAGAVAQDLSNAGPPAELPPPDYASNQYVDSRGCVYIRAGIAGQTSWVPRVNRSREVLCGFTPSLARAPEPTPPPMEAPEPDPVQTAAATPAPVTPAARPARTTPAPVPAVTPPAAVTTPRSPVITRVPSRATVAGPALTPPSAQTAAATPEARRMTRSEFCADKTGPQPGYISNVTRQTIDCGPGPEVAAATPAASAVRRATRTEICAEMASTGRRFLNVATGLPVRCPPSTPTTAVARSVFNPATAPVERIAGAPCDSFTNGDPTRCGNTVALPIYEAASAMAARVSTKTLGIPFTPPVPASNPTYARAATPTPPDGYDRVWTDGRLNPNRGLQSDSTEQQAEATARVSSRAAVPQTVTAPSNPYVQIGTFGSRASAQDVAKGLRARGLPMRIAVYERGGDEYRIVLVGPFNTQGQVNSALSRVRGLGYGSARPARY